MKEVRFEGERRLRVNSKSFLSFDKSYYFLPKGKGGYSHVDVGCLHSEYLGVRPSVYSNTGE